MANKSLFFSNDIISFFEWNEIGLFECEIEQLHFSLYPFHRFQLINSMIRLAVLKFLSFYLFIHSFTFLSSFIHFSIDTNVHSYLSFPFFFFIIIIFFLYKHIIQCFRFICASALHIEKPSALIY